MLVWQAVDLQRPSVHVHVKSKINYDGFLYISPSGNGKGFYQNRILDQSRSFFPNHSLCFQFMVYINE